MDFVLKDYHRNVSDEELLTDITRVAKALQKETITKKEYVNHGGKYHSSTIEKRFGGWVKALKKCGLSPSENQIYNHSYIHTHHRKNIPTFELIEDIKHVSEKLNKKTFSSSEYDENGAYSRNIMFNRFGTWNNALIAAGLIPFAVVSGKRISEFACFEEIERIWIMLGRQPTTTDIKNGISRYSLHVFERRFGSWRKALEAFVAYMNGEKEVEIPEETEDTQLPVDVQQINSATQPVHKTKREINLRMRFLVMKRDDFKCCMCGRSPATTPGLELHIDHIVPWSKGGETVIDNLQTLCSDCNLGKSDLSMD